MNHRIGMLLVVVGVTVALGLTSSSTAVAARTPFGGAGDDEHRAVDLLRRSASAMRTTSYSGTRMLSAWGRDDATTVLVDVEHVAGQGTRMSIRGGGIAEDTATFLAGRPGRPGHASGLTLEAFDLLTDTYAVTLGPRDSVVGRPSTVVEVSRADAVAARLWIDDRSGLLLRREVFDRSGQLARESVFIDIDVTGSEFMAHLPPATPEPAARGVGLADRQGLRAAGWDCPPQAGIMRLVDIEALDDTGGSETLHLTYSDGLTRMSVFEQRGSLDAESMRGFERLRLGRQVVHVRDGLPTYVMWEDAGLVFTAVTDGPLHSVADMVARRPQDPGDDLPFWERVASGLARLGGWASPLL
ncbi:MAG TPA: sigma-E factor regulatory protein RseB domain-containing protein [Nocardioidaceae bacterium]|nr:sigma-E factor regulatory protein RseB domain-containing protein [Nocardioidaceae bacterium]